MPIVADIITTVRDSLSDPSGDRWPDARLLRLLDEGQKLIARKARVIRDLAPIPLRISVAEYDLPTSAYLVTRAVLSTGKRLPLRSRAWMDEYDPTWEIATGSTPKFVVFDKLKPRRIKIYPIPTQVDGIEFDAVSSDYGVTVSSTGDALNSDYGVVVDIVESAVNTTDLSSDFGVLVEQSEQIATVLIHFIAKPTTVSSISIEDSEFSLDEIYSKALKHYIVGMALRDDKDTQNRQVGNEELMLFDIEMKEFQKIIAADFTQQTENEPYYNGGFR